MRGENRLVALSAESTGAINPRFTSYDRSNATGLDYAVNRHYDPQQGRFYPGRSNRMRSVSLDGPQTLNLYAYCTNDPINSTDPSGLGLIGFFKKVFRGIAKILTNKWVLLIAGIALGLLSGFAFYLAFSYATVNTTFLAYGIALAAMSALLIVGAFHQGFLRVVQTIGGVVSSVQGVANAIGGIINGGMLSTPPWNPSSSGVGAVSRFMAPQGSYQVPQNYYNILVDTVNAVRQRLKDRPKCRKLLGDINLEDTLSNRLSIGPRGLDGKIYFDKGSVATTLPDFDAAGNRLASGRINFNSLNTSPFFFYQASPQESRLAGINPSMTASEFRQLFLIHELVHVGDTAGIWNDTGPNARLNRRIRRDCF